MSNPYITKKDLKEILDDYDFGGKRYEDGFAGDEKLGGWAKWINERVNSGYSQNKSSNLDENSSAQGFNPGGFFGTFSGTGSANAPFGAQSGNSFFAGILLGAAATYFLTDENAQKKLFKLIAKGTEMFQMGVEEMKERFEDAKAEIQE